MIDIDEYAARAIESPVAQPPELITLARLARRHRRRGIALRTTIVCALVVVIGVGAFAVVGATNRNSGVTVIAPATNTVAFDANGDTVNLPTDWFRAAEPLAPQLVDPHEVLAISTVPLPAEGRAAVCVGDAPPARGLGAMAADDALIWLIEWTPIPAPDEGLVPNVATTDNRPARFAPEQFAARDCVTRAFPRLVAKSLLFKDQGRVFEVYVVYGESVSSSRQQEIYDTLDTLRFRDT